MKHKFNVGDKVIIENKLTREIFKITDNRPKRIKKIKTDYNDFGFGYSYLIENSKSFLPEYCLTKVNTDCKYMK